MTADPLRPARGPILWYLRAAGYGGITMPWGRAYLIPARLHDPALRAIGALLYSAPGWRTALAGDLGVSTRTIARYLDGEREIPEDVVYRLRRVADLRQAEIEAAREEIRQAG